MVNKYNTLKEVELVGVHHQIGEVVELEEADANALVADGTLELVPAE